MARRKKADTMLHNDKKMETVIDFGEITVPDKWEKVTLQMMSDYLTLSKQKEDDLELDKMEAKRNNTEMPNEKDEKYNITDKDLLRIFTNFDMEKYDILPVELYNSIMANFAFVLDPMPEWKPSKHLSYNGMEFVINTLESLKVKEYEDAEMILRNNMYDYPSLLAILCRKVTGTKTDNVTGLSWEVNEVYDSEFANEIFDARREMFANMPITKAMPLIGFFLIRGIESSNLSQNSLTTIAQNLYDTLQVIEDSQKTTGLRRLFILPQTIKLRKWKKYIKSTFLTSSNT